jgi:hypothetical protein
VQSQGYIGTSAGNLYSPQSPKDKQARASNVGWVSVNEREEAATVRPCQEKPLRGSGAAA